MKSNVPLLFVKEETSTLMLPMIILEKAMGGAEASEVWLRKFGEE